MSPVEAISHLMGLHARFLVERSIENASAFSAHVERLTTMGFSRLIEAAAQALQSEGGEGASLLNMSQDCAAISGLGDRMATGTLFAVPLVVEQSIGDLCLQALCIDGVRRALIDQGMALSIGDIRMDGRLWSQEELSSLDLGDIHGLRQGLSNALSLSTIDAFSTEGPSDVTMAMGTSSWHGQAHGRLSELQWVVGYCAHGNRSTRPSWLGGSDDEQIDHRSQVDSFIEAASASLSAQMGMAIEVGQPDLLTHKMRHGAFDEVANGLIRACQIHEVPNTAATHPFWMRVWETNDVAMGVSEAPLNSRSRIRVELLALHKSTANPLGCSSGSELLAHYELSCQAQTGKDALEDLVQVLRRYAGVQHIQTATHDASGDVLHPGFPGALADASFLGAVTAVDAQGNDHDEQLQVAQQDWSQSPLWADPAASKAQPNLH